MKNLKLVLAALALVVLGFAICKFVDRRHENENVRVQGLRLPPPPDIPPAPPAP